MGGIPAAAMGQIPADAAFVPDSGNCESLAGWAMS
jgi:hypothetical protein